jgi:hypothetical protein
MWGATLDEIADSPPLTGCPPDEVYKLKDVLQTHCPWNTLSPLLYNIMI